MGFLIEGILLLCDVLKYDDWIIVNDRLRYYERVNGLSHRINRSDEHIVYW